jgi:hypothetical protein
LLKQLDLSSDFYQEIKNSELKSAIKPVVQKIIKSGRLSANDEAKIAVIANKLETTIDIKNSFHAERSLWEYENCLLYTSDAADDM